MLDEISLDIISQIKAEKLKEASKSTTNRYLAVLRSVLIRARDEWEWIEKVPKVKLFKEPEGRERSLSPEQANRLLAELPVHLRDMALFTLHTGLRQSNVLQLEWSCVDLARCHAWLGRRILSNRKPISVSLNACAMDVLNRQIGKHPTRVFTLNGKPISEVVNLTWKRALVRAGIEDLRWHDLRHTWAT